MNTNLFPAAIVKGLIEYQDGTHYFGNTNGYNSHLNVAKGMGVVAADGVTVTMRGQAWYARNLKTIEKTAEGLANRCVFWDDTAVGEP